MTVAKLGFKVDTSSMLEATAALNELVAAAERAEHALSKLGFTVSPPTVFVESAGSGAMGKQEVAHLSAQMADHMANIERKS